MEKFDIDKISITDIVYLCFKNEIYVKTEIAGKNKLRIYADTPEGKIVGNELYNPDYKQDQKRMKEKIDEVYKYFYKKIRNAQEKNEQIVDT